VRHFKHNSLLYLSLNCPAQQEFVAPLCTSTALSYQTSVSTFAAATMLLREPNI
jgi:hypothetical protein